MYNPGRLNRRITIGKTQSGKDPDTGRFAGTVFVPVRELWAGVNYVKGSEFFQAAAAGAEKTVTFTVRYQPDLPIKTTDQIKYNNDIYDIQAINDVNATHDMLVITCTAVIDDE